MVWMERVEERRGEEKIVKIYLKLIHYVNLPLYSPLLSLHPKHTSRKEK
jgi:hypothetical protein